MLSIVCWKWKAHAKSRRHQKFTSEHVNTLKRMVARHYHDDHEFVCITDDPEGIDEDVRIIPIWDHLAQVPNPMGLEYPRCYRRLFAFSDEFKELIPGPFISLDLDCVIVDDVTDVFNAKEDFKIWAHSCQKQQYNGSMWLLRPGTRTKVWEEFDPDNSPRDVIENGYRGSDQGWFNLITPNEATWTFRDGIYNWDSSLAPREWRLPSDARVIFFCGSTNPWDEDAKRRAGWIDEHYR